MISDFDGGTRLDTAISSTVCARRPLPRHCLSTLTTKPERSAAFRVAHRPQPATDHPQSRATVPRYQRGRLRRPLFGWGAPSQFAMGEGLVPVPNNRSHKQTNRPPPAAALWVGGPIAICDGGRVAPNPLQRSHKPNRPPPAAALGGGPIAFLRWGEGRSQSPSTFHKPNRPPPAAALWVGGPIAICDGGRVFPRPSQKLSRPW